MNIKIYPEGFQGQLEVVSMTDRNTKYKIWTLRSTDGQFYQISPEIIKGRHINVRKEETTEISIIVSFEEEDVIALSLKTGELYRTFFPDSLSL